MKSEKAKTDTLKILAAILLVAVVALSYYVASMRSDIDALKNIPAIQQSMKLQEIISKLEAANETRGYSSVVSLEELSSENVRQLELQQPVIYNSLPDKALYRIVLSRGNESLFVIYDFEENRILRSFTLDRMMLGQ